jgi:hypothetical protein
MNGNTRKLLTMHPLYHPRADTEKLSERSWGTDTCIRRAYETEIFNIKTHLKENV